MEENDVRKVVRGYLKSRGLPVDKAVAFDDVYIIDRTSRSEKRSDITDFGTFLAASREEREGLKLNIPIVSANMADVTGAEMAIAIARLGGLGFIPQNGSVKERAAEVSGVKRADNEVIDSPWTIRENARVEAALQLMKERKISGLLVVDNNGKLVGILTERNMRFLSELRGAEMPNLRVGDIMTKDLVVAPADITIDNAIRLLHERQIEKLPLVDAKGKPAGLITAKDILKKKAFKKAARDSRGRLMVGATVGLSYDFLGEVRKLLEAGADAILVDTARGNSLRAAHVVQAIRRTEFKDIVLIAGNVDNAEGAELLLEAGADCIKVGIGPGSACKTRIETGVGAPQLTAIAECAAICRRRKAFLIADGGIRSGDDFAKALMAGADAVMIGRLFAGTEETPGEVYYDGDEMFKIYRGSASLDSQLERVDEGNLDYIREAEGVTRKIPYIGKKVARVVEKLLGNLRSSMSYADAFTIKEFQGGRFGRQTQAGHLEGQPKK